MADPVMTNISTGLALEGVEAVVVVTTDKNYLVKTHSDAELKAVVDAGTEKPLRKANTILALSKTLDLVKGFDVTLSDVLLHFETLAIVNGGAVVLTETVPTGYTGPVAGQAPTLVPARLDIYTKDLDTGGLVKGYYKFTLPNCTGKPTDFTLKDGDFFAPKLVFESRPTPGTAPIEISKVTTLPNVA